jgi:hypothetical protein
LFLQLGKIAASLRDQMSTPRDWFEMPDEGNAAGSQVGERIKDQMAARRRKTTQATQDAPPPEAAPPGEPQAEGAQSALQVSDDLRRDLLGRLEDRLLDEQRTHGGALSPPWEDWERELERLRVLPLSSPVLSHTLNRLAEALDNEES